MSWIIENDKGEAWSNTEGWTFGDDFETFSDDERAELDLPMGGRWVRVPWRKED